VTTLNAGNHALGNWALDFPLGWGVAKDTNVPYGDVVAEGALFADMDCNSSVDTVGTILLTNEPADPDLVAEWQGQITSWWLLSVSVDGSSVLGFDISADLTNVTEFHQICAPQTLVLTFYGLSKPSNTPVLTNSSSTGTHTWTGAFVSLGADHATQVTDTTQVCVCPIPDADGDGVRDEVQCGSDPSDSNERPERIDGGFAGVDDDGDTQVDELLPAGAENYDCDGDGYKGTAENNALGASVKADQRGCAGTNWPPNLSTGTFSSNKVDIQDLTSFISPVRRLNTSLGDTGYSARWDLVPGSNFGKTVNVEDMTNLVINAAPMFGGIARTFNGPQCPWPAGPLSDSDADGVLDELSCGSNPTNAGQRPERKDGIFAGVDDDGDGLVDEILPPGAQNYDCDGDGFKGSTETAIYAQVLAKDQDPCGTDANPLDFASGSVPNSTNKINIVDLQTFILPVRRLGASPGETEFNVRWDLVPGPGLFSDHINVADLQKMAFLLPPMLGGATREFNGPVCPWAP